MKNTLYFKDIEVNCIIGCLPQERSQKQKLFFDLCVDIDIPLEALQNDDLSIMTDYRDIIRLLENLVIQGEYLSIEALGYQSAHKLLSHFNSLKSVELQVKKPGASPKASYISYSTRVDRLSE